MITTRVFEENLKAYNAGYRYIFNMGGTRSSKTFSELQLIKLIQDNSKKQRVITAVSHSFPHLHGGGIRDFEKILELDGVNVDVVRTKNPHIYKINKSILEFVGFDRPGKALGSARDILLIIEANKMDWSVCHQLMQRTRECIFADWNPSEVFWCEEQGFETREDCKIITSTFYDNIQNLTAGQLSDLKEARKKAMDEDKAGKRGYWWNWWQVYGLGLKGQLEGVIFKNWSEYEILPDGLFKLWVIDWGGHDPTTLTELNFDGDNKTLYIREHIYQPQILNSKLIEYLHEQNAANDPVICDSARKDKIFELQMAEIKAFGSTKGEGSIIDGIERIQDFSIFIHKDSLNAKIEFGSYKWIKDEGTGKFLNVPEDTHNHIIDGVRYGVRFYRKSVRPI
jgi:phage terminase large subunit